MAKETLPNALFLPDVRLLYIPSKNPFVNSFDVETGDFSRLGVGVANRSSGGWGSACGGSSRLFCMANAVCASISLSLSQEATEHFAAPVLNDEGFEPGMRVIRYNHSPALTTRS
ncbi:unnamed protein product [Protopolystoma xenopodis]|uniref:Uncharacterized protein n=1 Tax=Protopolystoma xenopodis TaxID=117903 RepID=A0A3S5AVB7_9PLAT|nr:unnamed protein product [Protopolystoma xenopodis]